MLYTHTNGKLPRYIAILEITGIKLHQVQVSCSPPAPGR